MGSAAITRALIVAVAACGSRARIPELQIRGESALRTADATTPWFDGAKVTLVAARGETLGIQVYHPAGAVALAIPGATVESFAVRSLTVARPSTESLYGPGRGAGDYPDELVPAPAPDTNPAYFTISAAASATGTLKLGARELPVELTIADVTLPATKPRVWAYYDPRELAWAHLGSGSLAKPSAEERACIAMFRAHGVLLSPDMPVEVWSARKDLVDTPDIPAVIPGDPAAAGDAVRAWIDATKGTGQVPFAIPIDEPGAGQATEVKMLAGAVRAAGGGPTTFRYAVTADRSPTLGDIDLWISLRARRGDWAYNGAPPRAGSMTLDALSPGTRTWGWIAFRYDVPVWYAWDALYWHDRHRAKRQHIALPDLPFDRQDAISFDDGDDRGNLDGVLALPGDAAMPCHPTLRLEALRRGQQDRALLELAARCKPVETKALAEKLIPAALADAGSSPAWPTDDAAFEVARRTLLDYARCR
jgi:hypothetical protein